MPRVKTSKKTKAIKVTSDGVCDVENKINSTNEVNELPVNVEQEPELASGKINAENVKQNKKKTNKKSPVKGIAKAFAVDINIEESNETNKRVNNETKRPAKGVKKPVALVNDTDDAPDEIIKTNISTPNKRRRKLNKVLNDDNKTLNNDNNIEMPKVKEETPRKSIKRKVANTRNYADQSLKEEEDEIVKKKTKRVVSKAHKTTKAALNNSNDVTETLSLKVENSQAALSDVLQEATTKAKTNRKKQTETNTVDNEVKGKKGKTTKTMGTPLNTSPSKDGEEKIKTKKKANKKATPVNVELMDKDILHPTTEKPKTNRKRKVGKEEPELAVDINEGSPQMESIEQELEGKKLGIKTDAASGTRARTRKRSPRFVSDNAEQNEQNEHVENGELIDEPKPTNKNKKRNNQNKIPVNKTQTVYTKEDFEYTGEPQFNLKISSWNVAGLRSWLTKGGLTFLEYEEPDIFCMQETKCTFEQLPEEVAPITGYHPYWLCMPGGYAGVAIYSKIMPINVEYGIGDKDFDSVGRLITAEYEKFFLINVYVPNSGRKLVNLEARMRWEQLFQEFVQKLDKRKPVIVCGDMNVSHQEIDLANPKSNTRNAGFTKEEREKMTELLSLGFVDTFRHLYPMRKGAYTFWTYMGNARSRNVGWRLDYFIVSERFIKNILENCMRTQCLGSDHCPITLFLKL